MMCYRAVGQPARLRAIALRYLATRRGPLAMSVNQAGGFVRSDASRAEPNLQLYFNPISLHDHSGPAAPALLKPDPFSAFLLSFNACRPTSRGHLEIRSANPFDAPAIHPKLACDRRGSWPRRHRRNPAAARYRRLRAALEIHRVGDAARFIQADRRGAAGGFSPACGHRIPPGEHVPDGAGSSRPRWSMRRLRVHGVEGAARHRRIGFSRLITSGNTNAPTIMVAEKGAALVAAEEGA